ncbi:MAG: hypothetical protein OXC70_09305 [Gammaproteobacteria bacterium]|nr:hypothetical protein [Gammaproteobacteria bacterium]
MTTANRRGWFAPKIVVLFTSLALLATSIFFAAHWLRQIVLHTPAADGGEWASLLGGGFATCAFFLIRSGLIERTFDLAPRFKEIWQSLRSPGWSSFFGSLGGLYRLLALPGIVTVFALVFVGESVREQIIESDASADIDVRIDELAVTFDSGLARIEERLQHLDLRVVLTEQGYTKQRADLMENLERVPQLSGGDASEHYVARFPILFEPASLNMANTDLVAGVDAEAVQNPELIEQIATALLPCGAEDGADPVILKVEGYSSSEPFAFRENVGSDSDLWNVRTANRRRNTVAVMLENAIGNGNRHRVVVCESEDYASLADMQLEREFNDRPRGQIVGRLAQDVLTRAAHVKVLHPGLCSVRKTRLTRSAMACLQAGKTTY